MYVLFFSFRVNLDESMKNLGNLTALSMAIVCTPGVYMVRTLIDLGASVNKKGLGDKTAEELAIMLNRKDLIHFFNEKKSYRSSEFLLLFFEFLDV